MYKILIHLDNKNKRRKIKVNQYEFNINDCKSEKRTVFFRVIWAFFSLKNILYVYKTVS